jgi:methionine synthase I (cobalamin-dependent)
MSATFDGEKIRAALATIRDATMRNVGLVCANCGHGFEPDATVCIQVLARHNFLSLVGGNAGL